MIQEHSKENLIKRIEELDKGIGEVYINMRPSYSLVIKMKKELPNLHTIMCPPSLLAQTSNRVFKLLRTKGIKIKEKGVRVGRPMVHKEKEIDKVLSLRKKGVPAAKIAEKLGIPTRTVYYYLKNKAQ